MMWEVLIGAMVALLASWLALVVALLLVRPKGSLLSEAIRILPDLLRLLRRLAVDRTVPRSARVRLGLLLAYLAIPIDLIPDFLPIIGYADDAIITVAVLRAVVNRAGIEAVRRQWPGSEDGFAALRRLAGIKNPPTRHPPSPPHLRLDPPEPLLHALTPCRDGRARIWFMHACGDFVEV